MDGQDDQHQHQDGAAHLHTGTDAARTVILEQKVLAKNDRLAALNREWLAERSVLAINLMGDGLRDALDPRMAKSL